MAGLSFLYPLFLIAAAAAAIPVLLHLFRRRTEVVVDFPAVRLLRKGPVEQHHRRRLRELLLLALRVAALLLLALAFARPYVPTLNAGMPAPITIVALDSSLSLSAPGQFERARQLARDAVAAAPSAHNVGLLTFADATSVVVAPTTDRGIVTSAIDQAQPSAGGTRFRTALARAAEIIGGNGGRIVVVTDLQQAGWESSDEGAVPDGIEIEVIEVTSPPGNVAVTSVRRERDAIVAGVHNFGLGQVRTAVQLRTAEREIVTQHVDVAPQAAAEVRLSAPSLPEAGGLEVRVDDPVGYQGDNVRYVVLDSPAAVPILIVTAEPPATSNAGLYIERALAVAEDGRAFSPRVVDGRRFSAMTADQFGTPGAIVLLGTSTLDRAGRERIAGFVRGGGRVLLTLGPDVDLATLADTVGTRVDVLPDIEETSGRITLVAADTRHPIFRPFTSPSGALGDVQVERYRRLKEGADRVVLARFSGAGDALIEQTVERGRLLVFASDLDNRWNRFPLNPAFVPWAIETARYLTQGRDERQSFTLPEIPPGVPSQPGVHRVGERLVAVNPDVRESNPARVGVDEFVGGITRLNQVAAARAEAAARDQEERQRLWQLGLLVMFLALASEGLIGRRAA